MRHRRQQVTAPDGVKLSVSEGGNPGGKPILLIHGFCASKYVFAKQFDSAILSTYRLISFDLRGHGESDKPSEANFYTEGHRWADDVKSVMDHLGIHRPILAGWSLGGRVISQYLAVHGGDEIAGINFVSSRNAIDPQRDVLGPASHFFKTMDTDDLLENIERTSQFVERSYAMPMSEKDIRFMIALKMVVPPQVRAAILRWPADFNAALRKLDLPCLITHGRKDEIILPLAAEVTAGLVRNAKISWYDDCGHGPLWESPTRFNSELAAFRAAHD